MSFCIWVIRLAELTLFIVPESVNVFTSEAGVFSTGWSGWIGHTLRLRLRATVRAARVLNALHLVSCLTSKLALVLEHRRVL